MKRPVVGVVGNQYMINDQYPVHAAGRMTTWAVSVSYTHLTLPTKA